VLLPLLSTALVWAQAGECLKCHQPLASELKKRSVHPGDCLTCHVDHPAAPDSKPPYLKGAQPALCLGCHDARAPKFTAAHQQQPVETASCTICHDPHASRLRKLLYEIQHGPFAGRHCDDCHAEPRAGRVQLIGGKVNDLCLSCHVVIDNQLARSKSAHGKLPCTACHTPHTSNYRPHLKVRREALCRSCHKQLAAEAKFAH